MNGSEDANAAPTRIVIVEDDAPLADALRYVLQTQGFAVDIFDSAAGFLASSLDPEPNCVILDHFLGAGATGIEALEAVRARGFGAPAILVTTRPTAALRRRAELAGACVLEKPILGERILEAVGSLIGRATPGDLPT